MLFHRGVGGLGQCLWVTLHCKRQGWGLGWGGGFAVNCAAVGCWNMFGAQFGNDSSSKSVSSLHLSDGDLQHPKEGLTVLFAALSCAPNLAAGCLFSESGNLRKGATHKTSSKHESFPRAWHLAEAPSDISNLEKKKKRKKKHTQPF